MDYSSINDCVYTSRNNTFYIEKGDNSPNIGRSLYDYSYTETGTQIDDDDATDPQYAMSEGDDDCGSNNTEYDDDATGPQYASSEAHDGFKGYPSRMTQSWSQSPSYVPHPEFVQNDEGGSDYDDEEDDDTVPQYPASDGYTSFETTQSRSTPNDGEAEDPVCDWDVFSFESNPEETNRSVLVFLPNHLHFPIRATFSRMPSFIAKCARAVRLSPPFSCCCCTSIISTTV